MSSGAYPPGVSGFEPAIAGAQYEYDETRWVEHECDEPYEKDFTGDVTGTVIQWDYTSRDFVYECEQCGQEVTITDDPDDFGPDVD